jgi:hypothetical protein
MPTSEGGGGVMVYCIKKGHNRLVERRGELVKVKLEGDNG